MEFKYKNFYFRIFLYQKIFDFILYTIKTEKDFDIKLQLAQELILKATFKNCGILCSPYLEKLYTDYAKKIDIKNYGIDYAPNSYLHVLSRGYNKGGHTRVVERWIKNAPSEQIHSVVVINPEENVILSTLKENVKNKNGEYIEFEKASLENKALLLREIALKYEYIILHIHMDDPTALVAFGTEKFTRPVLFYNHASHLFSMGISVADKFLDLNENDEYTLKKRYVSNPFPIGVPVDISNNIKNIDKFELRKKLRIPVEKKIIISSGDENKFNPIGNDSIVDVLLNLAENDYYIYLIGPSKENEFWRNLNIQSNNCIIPLGYINYADGYLDYIASADIVLDSYPMPGGAASIDAINLNVPVLSLKSVLKQFDYLISTSGYCETKQELLYKINDVLSNNEIYFNLLSEQKKSLEKYQSKQAWLDKLNIIFSNTEKSHSVKDLTMLKENKTIDDLSVMDNFMLNKDNFTKKIKYKRIIISFIKILFYRYIVKNKTKEINNILKLYE